MATPTLQPAEVLDRLAERDMVAQCTDAHMHDRLSQPRVLYNGFDPTADSLHVGHMVPIMGMAWMQRCGHKPIAVVGGATALVGDPSGKTAARQMLTPEQVGHNAQCLREQLSRFMRFDPPSTTTPDGGLLLNNADWLGDLNWIDMLREVGTCLSVNRMLTMDSVRGRMNQEGDGISFLEFNYMVMQAYDFLHLARTHGCTVQTGGQDQWGNIVMGIELGRRLADISLAGLTFPLVTKADGGKFGKTESGTVWLSAERTSPYDFYQVFRNTQDGDVVRYLHYFTFLPVEACDLPPDAQGPAINAMKELLAYEVTALVHGPEQAQIARDAAQRAFGQGDVTAEGIPSATMAAGELEAGVGLLTLLTRAGMAQSNGEGRRLVQAGGVRLHDRRIDDPQYQVSARDVEAGYILLRAGKKRLFRFDVRG